MKRRDERFEEQPSKTDFLSYLGLELEDTRAGWARLSIGYREELKQPMGLMHGGVLASLADAAVAAALRDLVEPDERFVTIELKINFLRPVTSGKVTAEARILKKGRRIAVGEVDIWREDQTLAAKSIATYAILAPEAALKS